MLKSSPEPISLCNFSLCYNNITPPPTSGPTMNINRYCKLVAIWTQFLRDRVTKTVCHLHWPINVVLPLGKSVVLKMTEYRSETHNFSKNPQTSKRCQISLWHTAEWTQNRDYTLPMMISRGKHESSPGKQDNRIWNCMFYLVLFNPCVFRVFPLRLRTWLNRRVNSLAGRVVILLHWV